MMALILASLLASFFGDAAVAFSPEANGRVSHSLDGAGFPGGGGGIAPPSENLDGAGFPGGGSQ